MKFQSFAQGDCEDGGWDRLSVLRLGAGAGSLTCGRARLSSVCSNGLPCWTASAGTARAAKDTAAMMRFMRPPLSWLVRTANQDSRNGAPAGMCVYAPERWKTKVGSGVDPEPDPELPITPAGR